MEKIINEIFNKLNITVTKISKATTGFTNVVYFVNDEYVIKFSKNEKTAKKLQKEIGFYQTTKLTCKPKYIASGFVGDMAYLIITKIEGYPLYKVWHTLSEDKRERLVEKICEILKQIHTSRIDFLEESYVFNNLTDKWVKSFEKNIKELNKRGITAEKLEVFVKTKLAKIFAEEKPALVYNDAHFDNFIYNEKEDELYIIDFDRLVFTSADYELLIIVSMVNNPKKFASLEDEKNCKKSDYKNILNYMKKYYPRLFDFEWLDDRIFVYRFVYNLGNAFEYNKTNIIKTQLEMFEKYFNL